MRHTLLVALALAASAASTVHVEPFADAQWEAEAAAPTPGTKLTIFVGLALKTTQDALRADFLAVSTPNHARYGQHMSKAEVERKYGPDAAATERLVTWFRQALASPIAEELAAVDAAVVEAKGRFLRVATTVAAAERAFGTTLAWHRTVGGSSAKRAIRAVAPLAGLAGLPKDLEPHVAFVSLNSPVLGGRANPLGGNAGNSKPKVGTRTAHEATLQSFESTAAGTVTTTSGNEQALVYFQPFCGGGSRQQATLNDESPPCASAVAADPASQPAWEVSVSAHANNASHPFPLDTEPVVFTVDPARVSCFSKMAPYALCDGTDGPNCVCAAKVGPLPKYTQLRATVTQTAGIDVTGAANATFDLGASALFALTDVATTAFLAKLYNIPPGLTVRHGSNNSVAEFYGEFFSNADLASFTSLSGLPLQSIPAGNVLGDLPNDQANPGGEAQLDVEYLMGLAPNAATYFYSMGDLNPYDEANEGFLEFLSEFSAELWPPLVVSLSYGDGEGTVFNTSNPGSIAYGDACDNEFMLLGLRGVTIVVSSGDDGIGSSSVRGADFEQVCAQANPNWPASSPYVTSVGATQMTNAYLPACELPYSNKDAFSPDQALAFQCTGTGETVCSSTFGGVITSGGGFSDYYDRAATAPWQTAAVASYLKVSAAAGSLPPLSYFNSNGRAYPDVATYGSNYFVYLRGQVTRESGTSASAPVMAAMVTLWNDMRFAYGLPALGFLNPLLYAAAASTPEAFNDVTTGNNACAAGGGLELVHCCPHSFAAVAGYDAATGFGSPNFQTFASMVLDATSPFPASVIPAAVTATPAATDDEGDDDKHGKDDDKNGKDDDDEGSGFNVEAASIAGLSLSLTLILAAAGYVAFSRNKGRASSSGGGASSPRGVGMRSSEGQITSALYVPPSGED